MLILGCGSSDVEKKKKVRPEGAGVDVKAIGGSEIKIPNKRRRALVEPAKEYMDLAKEGVRIVGLVASASVNNQKDCDKMAVELKSIADKEKRILAAIAEKRYAKAQGIELTRAGTFHQDELAEKQKLLNHAFQCSNSNDSVKQLLNQLLGIK